MIDLNEFRSIQRRLDVIATALGRIGEALDLIGLEKLAEEILIYSGILDKIVIDLHRIVGVTLGEELRAAEQSYHNTITTALAVAQEIGNQDKSNE